MHRLIDAGRKSIVVLSITLMSTTLPARPANATRPAVVELFTSQGCSSCPPADALLGELAKRPDVLALAFHVDYWDGLGWRDRFALPEAAQRQRRYVQSMQLSTMFTPQAVIDGRRSVLGSNRSSVVALIDGQRDNIPVALTIADGKLLIDLAERKTHSPLDINVVAYLPEASTPISRGENTGRVLHEFNVVRTFRTLGAWQGQAEQLQLKLSTLPQDASRIAVLVQQPQQGAIVGAAAIVIH